MSERVLKNEWESAAYNRETNEWDTTTLRSYAYPPDTEPFSPATPAIITPSEREPANRDYKSIFVFSDAQIDYRRVIDDETHTEQLIPIHNERAMAVARQLCSDLQPDTIVNLGDTVDLAGLSRFKLDSDHFHRTIGPSFQRAHDFYAGLRADNPRADIVEVDSNHNTRLKDFMLKNMPQMYGVRRAGEQGDYPVMSYPYLANLGHLGVKWVSGYGSAEYQYADDLAFIHGTMSNAAGSTASRLAKANYDRNIVQGHAHRAESFHHTTRRGEQLGAYVVGALCRTTGEVPSYGSAVDDMGNVVGRQENWQNGLLHIEDYGDGHYNFNHILIHDGKAFYQGREYGNE